MPSWLVSKSRQERLANTVTLRGIGEITREAVHSPSRRELCRRNAVAVILPARVGIRRE
jgi:hypothetical protein